jgi:serine O-acetyltransferase
MKNLLKLIRSDWRRYSRLHKKRINFFLGVAIIFHNPGFIFTLMYRIERYFIIHKNPLLHYLGWFFYPFYFLFSYYVFDTDISPQVKIGSGLYIHNRGIIFTNAAVVGNNAIFIGPITVGTKGLGGHTRYNRAAPNIGDNVTVFTGARIIGGVKIGNNVYVGANAVVVKDIPANSVVGGVPAKIIKRLPKKS